MTKIKIDPVLIKRLLTADEALYLLAPHKEGRKLRVHTFQGGVLFMAGCDMDLTILKKRLKKCKADEIVLSGENMRGMGHGVAYWTDEDGWTFLEADKLKVSNLHIKRKIK